MGSPETRHLELRSVGWRLGVGLSGLAALVSLLGFTWSGGGDPRTPVLVGVLGMALALILLAEWPRRVTFDVDGIERRSLLRKRRIPWGEVDSLERLPPRMVASLDALTTDRSPKRRGLAARTVRGSLYILSTSTESPEEMRALQQAVTQWAPYCRMSLLR